VSIPNVGASSFDVTPDGQRFLVLQSSADSDQYSLTVLLNWQAGLKK
jgi:hypothetical protein